MIGYIKLHRQLVQWEWYSDTNVFRLFIHLLLTANYKDSKYKGKTIKRGQAITGQLSTPQLIGLSVQQYKTAIIKLKSTNEINTESTNQYTVVTLTNYDLYQEVNLDSNQRINQQINQPITNNQPTDNQRITTLKERKKERKKEEREEKEKNPTPKGKYENINLKEKQYEELLEIYISENLLNEAIEKLSEKTYTNNYPIENNYQCGNLKHGWVYNDFKTRIKELKTNPSVGSYDHKLTDTDQGKKIAEEFIKEFGQDIYNSWLSKLYLESIENDTATFLISTQFVKDWIKKEYFEGKKREKDGKKFYITKGIKQIMLDMGIKNLSIDVKKAIDFKK